MLDWVYKAKYLRHTIFLDAKCFTTSSYIWKSIIQSKNLLKAGLKWIVGNGWHNKIWKDPWIHSKPARPTTRLGWETHPHLMVKDLINNISKTWEEQRINILLSQHDVQYAEPCSPYQFWDIGLRPPLTLVHFGASIFINHIINIW